jgi:hypothetical protein
MLAELRLIRLLEQRSDERAGYYEDLMLVKTRMEAFLTDENPDVRQLAGAIASFTEVAGELDQRDADIIAGILRRGSDRNRARYIMKLLDTVEPPGRRRGGRGSPDPDPSPSSTASPRALEPAPRTREK